MWADIINASFEVFGGFFILNHCRIVYKDKMVAGVSIASTVFFSCWGLWNIYYYPSLDQLWSFYGGIFIVCVNSLYVGLLIYYRNNKPRKEDG